MTAEITMRQIWWNDSVRNFFFREQAQDTLDDLMDAVVEDTEEILDAIEDYTDDLDEVEELLYNEPLDELVEIFNLTPMDVDDEDFEDEED